ncbi:hypothetical protein [Curtobacterium sp. MCBD17_032]|uniref:hypothetical protein n=1 Tax=Curtobacterium sp. MCBD17_032 TaxID=2175659 RepID=UPI0011B8203B|nr:hypothetical protein [Curtobacterium sp. MCBD17_032]
MRTPRETFGFEGTGRSWARVLLDLVSGTLVLSGGAVIASSAALGHSTAIWIGSGVILLGVVCWVASIFLSVRAARREPQDPSR